MKKKVVPEERLLRLIKKEKVFQTNNNNSEASAYPVVYKAENYKSFLQKRSFYVTLISVLILSLTALSFFFYANPSILKNSLPNKEFKTKDDELATRLDKKALNKKKNKPETGYSSEEKIMDTKIHLQEIKKVPVPPPSHLSLLGIIDGNSPLAIIQNKETGEIITLGINEILEQFRIEKIEIGQVTFSNEKEMFILRL